MAMDRLWAGWRSEYIESTTEPAGPTAPETRSVSPSAGLARWMTAFRSEPRAASPVPSSSMITASDWRTGSVEMFWTMSESIGELVRVTASK